MALCDSVQNLGRASKRARCVGKNCLSHAFTTHEGTIRNVACASPSWVYADRFSIFATCEHMVAQDSFSLHKPEEAVAYTWILVLGLTMALAPIRRHDSCQKAILEAALLLGPNRWFRWEEELATELLQVLCKPQPARDDH